MQNNPLIRLLKFPFWFAYFVIKNLLQAAGVKRPPSPEVLLGIILCAILIWFGYGRWTRYASHQKIELADPGVPYVRSTTSDSVISISALESAFIEFERRHKRLPRDWPDLRNADIIRGMPQPEEGFDYELDMDPEYPRLTKVAASSAGKGLETTNSAPNP
ncbi:MAG: hypothetical protein ACKVHO_11200 [Verrucomicrobiia bacterium]|jgi:hypothetical protein